MEQAACSERSVLFNGCKIVYQLEYKPVKNLNLRIRKDGSVYLSANDSVSPEQADSFVVEKGEYILTARRRFAEAVQYRPQPKAYVSGETFYIQGRGLRLQVEQGRRDTIASDGVYIRLQIKNPEDFEKKKRMVAHFLDTQCKRVFQDVASMIYPMFEKYGVAMPAIRIRDMETRWGSCLPRKGIITLNKRLLETPRNCIEYVVLHEFCHFIHPNHSKQFYSFVTMLMPDWRERKRSLDQCAEYWL